MPISPLARTIMLAVGVAFGAAPVLAKGGSAAVEAAIASAALGKEIGRYDAARKCRRVTARSDGVTVATCLKITKTVEVDTASGPRIHVLLAGDNPKEDCHACPGVVAFATFAPATPAWRLVARSVPRLDGSWGRANPPENFRVSKLGAELWGWVETTSYTGQGTTSGLVNIFLPHDESIVEAGSLPGDHDNSGNCEEGKSKTFSGEDCEDVKIMLGVDLSEPAARYYPIVLTAGGRVGTRPVNGRFVVPFDPKSYRYVEPKGVP
jgi:hypothetical protein